MSKLTIFWQSGRMENKWTKRGSLVSYRL